jgi:hypothetical protein
MQLRTLQRASSRYAAWRIAGMSLVEVLISTSIGLLALGGLITLISVAAKEQRREMVNSNLQQEANLLEDKITRLIRAMSATQAAILLDPLNSGVPFYRSIIVARAPAPTPREKLAFDAATFTCMHTPDLKVAGITASYFKPSSVAVLRNLYFFISEKTDGAPDASAITVYFQMDDNGMGTSGKTNSVTRSFTATMRNN